MAIPPGLLESIDALKPLPITAQRLMEAMGDQKTSLADIADIIEYDEAVVANVVRVANSSLYMGFSQIVDVRGALARLGTSQTASIVLNRHMARLCVNAPAYELTENELWLHGAVASLAATEIMIQSMRANIPGIVCLAALLHDIGKLIVVRYLKADVRALVRHSMEKHVTFVQAEAEILGCTHPEIGAAMGRKWRFPEQITQAIGQHHDVPIENPTSISDAVQLANLVAKNLGVGLGAERMNFRFDLGTGDRLAIDCRALHRICGRTNQRMAVLKDAYYDVDREQSAAA